MTPALIFLGIPPTTAVANDLVAAAVNKSVGAAVHLRSGSPNMRLAACLILGVGADGVRRGVHHRPVRVDAEQQSLRQVGDRCHPAPRGGDLRRSGPTSRCGRKMLARPHRPDDPLVRPLPTLVIGAVGGLLVGLTSVGSGSLIMVALLILYPDALPVRLVGTDLVQAIPLVRLPRSSHVIVSGVDWAVLVPLVVGGSARHLRRRPDRRPGPVVASCDGASPSSSASPG